MQTTSDNLKMAKDRLMSIYAQLGESKALYKAQEVVKFNC